MIRKTAPAAVMAVGALLALSACGGAGSTASTGEDGVKMGPGVTDSEIAVGILSDYSGPIAEAATSGSLGMEVKFDQVNAAGGICGRDVVAVKADTKADPQQTTQAYRSVSRDIAMVGQLLGTSSVNAVKDNIERDGLPTMAISMNTATLGLTDVYVPLPVFEVELVNGLVWAAEQAGASEDNPVMVGIVTASDEYGKTYAEAMTAAAESLPGVEIVANPTFTLSDKDYTAQITELQSAGAEYVMLGTAPAETAGLIGGSAQLGYDPSWIMESGSWYVGLGEPLAGLLDKTYVSAGYGGITDDVPGITELKAAIAEHAPDSEPSNFQVAGWLFAEAVVAGLEAACDNKDLSREGIIEGLTDLEVDYQGIAANADLGDGDSIASFSSRMNTIAKDGNLVPITDFAASDAAIAWAADAGL